MRVLGINDDVTTCECCGKCNLKCTVALDRDGETVYFGRACAARALKTTTTRIVRMAEDSTRQAEKEKRETVYEIGAVRSVVDWMVWTVGNNGGSVTLVALANGSKMEVIRWAESKWRSVDVQGMSGLTSGKRIAV